MRCTPMRHTHEMHARKAQACVRGARLYIRMYVYEVYAAVGAHLGGTRLGDVRLENACLEDVHL